MPDDISSTLPSCHGLLWGRRLGRAETLDAAEVEAAVAAGAPAEPLWLHFDLLDTRAHDFLQALSVLPPQARDTLDERAEVAHLEAAGETVWGSLVDFHYEVSEEPCATQMGMLHMALTPNLLVTARRHPLRALRIAGHEPATAGTPAAQWDQILRTVLDGIGRAIATLSERLNSIEDRLLQDRPVARAELAAARREVVLLFRRVEPSARLYADLAEQTPAWLERAGHDAGRAAARFDSALRMIASLQERGRIAQDELAARAAEETNRRLMVLSVLTTILLPPTLVTGIFGMNTTSLPGTSDPGGFWWALGAMALAAGVAVLVLVRLGLLDLGGRDQGGR